MERTSRAQATHRGGTFGGGAASSGVAATRAATAAAAATATHTATATATHLIPYRNLFHAFATIVRLEGLRAVYKGVDIVVVGAAPSQAMYFAGLLAVRGALSSPPPPHTPPLTPPPHSGSGTGSTGSTGRAGRAGSTGRTTGATGATITASVPRGTGDTTTSNFSRTRRRTRPISRPTTVAPDDALTHTPRLDDDGINFVAGLGAQACASVAWVPIEVVKERMMIQNWKGGGVARSLAQGGHTYRHSWAMVRSMVAREGVASLYRGYWLQQLTYGPFNGFSILFYERLKSTFPPSQRDTLVVQLPCATVAYGVAAALTNPLDVVKTRRQVQSSCKCVRAKSCNDVI